MTERALNELYDYAVTIRRQLHQYPEVGFELERTCALVAEELDKIGLAHTDRYGTCSLVAELGPEDCQVEREECHLEREGEPLGPGVRVIALRADMDALPVQEKTDVPYCSRIPGCMHACGHDSHTAILLAVAKYLRAHEDELPCRVRLIFQPSEEGAVSGAKMMVDNGVMDGVDEILCTHCDNAMDASRVGICKGDYMAACIPGTICFHGKTSHAALPEYGIDAVAMGIEAYGELKEMVAVEAQVRGSRYIWCVGHFTGGQVHNVVPDECQMDISFRFYDMEFAGRVEARIHEICRRIAKQHGGSVDMHWNMSTGPVHNNEAITDDFEQAAVAAGMKVQEMPQRMSSEDFGWYLAKAPGMIFRFGTRNEELGCTALAHRNDFKIDEAGMKEAIRAFVAYVMTRQGWKSCKK